VLLFPQQLVSETFFILRRIQRDTTIHVHRSACDVQLFLPDFKETWIFRPIFE